MKRLSLVLPSVLAIAAGCNVTTVAPPFQSDPPTPNQPTTNPVFNGAAIQAETPPVPVSGGSLIVVSNATGASLAVVSDPDEDAIDVVSIEATPKLVGTIQLQPGDEPGRLVADAHGLVHVALRRGGAVVTIDPTTPSLLSRRDVCPAPRGLDYDAKADSVLVACATGELVTLPAAGGAATRTVRLDRDLRDVMVSGDTVYVTRFRSAELLTVDATGAIINRVTPSVSNIGQPDVAWRTVLDSSAKPVMLHQIASTQTIQVAVPPTESAYGSGGSNSQMPINSVVAMAVGQPGSNVSVEVAVNPAVDFTIAPALPPYYPSPVTTVLGINGTIHFDVSVAAPVQLASAPNAEFVAIADASHTPLPSLVVQQRGPTAALWIVPHASSFSYSFGTPIVVPLPQKVSHADTGFDVFHVPTSAGVACMNCHPEGGDDGHTWQFQTQTELRLRRTQSLHGGSVSNSAPYHWDGDMSDLQMLCDEVFTHRMGGGSLLSKQTLILARWLGAIPRVPVRTDLDQNKVAAGKALFEGTAGCSGCHTGDRGTLPTNMSIGKSDGTGATSPLQVPMLIDVADRAPYMHDGCAKDLMSRFTGSASCVGSAHGNTAGLTDTDRANLVEYLESL